MNVEGWSPRNDMQVIYTGHGFHFYKGAPLKYWFIYYNVEKWLSRYTDKLVTINHEDYEYAKKFKAKKAYMIDGIGVDGKRFEISLSDDEKAALKKELSSIKEGFTINESDIVVTYVAELIPRKNQDLLINAMKDICNSDNQIAHNIKVLLVGTGILKEHYENRIKELGLESNVLLTGYRKDVPKIFRITDIGISTSKQEGLGLNLIESLLSDVPVIGSKVRGHDEIIADGENGLFFKSQDVNDLEEKIIKLSEDKELRNKMKKNAKESVRRFLLESSLKEMIDIYNDKV